MKMVKEVMFFPNGNTAAFDHAGNQIPELQQSWFVLYIRFLQSQKVVPEGTIFTMPSGDKAEVIRLEGDRWNWRIL